MIANDHILISDDLKSVYFSCDLPECKGACCVEGDAGAPLEEEEIALIEDHFEEIRSFMTVNGLIEVETNGVFDYDAGGRFVTPLIRGKECAFVYFENTIARCAIEKAFTEKKIPFRKPLSCHLYPVRIAMLRTGESVNYHKWPICRKALEKGSREKIFLYRYLEEPLIRKYGPDWYHRLLNMLK